MDFYFHYLICNFIFLLLFLDENLIYLKLIFVLKLNDNLKFILIFFGLFFSSALFAEIQDGEDDGEANSEGNDSNNSDDSNSDDQDEDDDEQSSGKNMRQLRRIIHRHT